ncbi:hypothetical protein PMIN06_013123, partial [Paraphaeosphaeria minitans]
IEQTTRQLIYLLNLQQRRYSKYKQKPKLIEQGLKAPSGTIPQKRSKIVPSTRRLRPIAPKPMRSSLGGMTKVSPSDRVDNIDPDRFYPPPISSIEARLSHDAVTGVGPQDQMSVPPNESDASRRAQVDSNIIRTWNQYSCLHRHVTIQWRTGLALPRINQGVTRRQKLMERPAPQ